ncbi:hypothetical protein RZC90_006255 [Pseudomonas aeruginosa]|nr:hypothetical protein [Pseudomonas aeruginosa]EKW5154026.1 hypothetical protein [Pseudomonas aeruginosa]EKW7673484.1 hypothetical protein [Pseudomonas aeruginosa]EKX0141228.1 hypothetical protein [Pseudomonas aeruginosa]EKY1791746.1 hypothetical protein [Pseudomonas aeruginosa]
MPVGAFGIGSERPDRAPSIHRYATSVEIFDSTTVDSVATGISDGSVLTIGYDGSDLRGAQMFFGQVPASTVKGRCGKFSSAPIFEFYTTINTTRATDGTLRAASPVVRIANVDGSLRPDLNELDFEPAGAWGVANAEARGVTVQRLAVGVYKVSGSLGLAKEGWRVINPASPDGGRPLGITDSEQAEDGTVTIRLFKQRWTLSDDGEMVLGKGAPLDVPLNSWIDVRLSMPAPPEMQPETL